MKKILIITLQFCLVFMANISFATSAEVKGFIDRTSSDVIKIAGSSSTNAQKQSSLTKIFLNAMDVDWVAKFVMGQHWNALSQEQKVKYMAAYRKFLIAKYVMLFKDYNGQSMRIDDVKDLGNNTYLATTFITNVNDKSSEYKVQYRIKEDGSNFKIRDIIAENISMLSTQRSDFSSIMSSSGFNGLVDKLNSKSTSQDTE